MKIGQELVGGLRDVFQMQKNSNGSFFKVEGFKKLVEKTMEMGVCVGKTLMSPLL